MGRRWLWIGGAAFLVPTAASAADQLKFGKPPEWVVEQAIPPASGKSPDAPVSILLTDQQIRFEPGKTVSYVELAMKLQTAEGLGAGNVSLPWNPATDTVTVNKLQIRRGDQVIDVLASGQTFTTMRRETNLDVAMLDGVLTANMQPEGLQQGDIIDLATTTEHVDPVLGNHVEANFGESGGSPIQLAHLHVDWPRSLPLKVQAKGFATPQTERGGRKIIELTQKDIEPAVPPKGAPLRFAIARLGEATDFASWSDVAALMAPLYRKAEFIPATGALHDEVEKLRAASIDPKQRAASALQLVQDRVRYVALLMGQGSYVPADAGTTWSRRFGDCKGKTALLLGILHSLGIEAEPIIIQSRLGDAIPERLPLLSYFDHVLVRAHVGGKTYYLDGTRTGDTNLDAIEVPDFGWGLPVVAGAQLVAMVPPPLDHPQTEKNIVIDASAGIYAPASVVADEVLRGDLAVRFNSVLTALTDAQRREFFESYWKNSIADVTPGTTSFIFEKAARQLHLSVRGTMKLDWSGGFFHVPNSSIGYVPDLDRPNGPFHDAPIAVSHPAYSRDVTTVRLPPAFLPENVAKLVPEPVHSTLIGVEYSRIQSATPNSMTVETVTRSLVPEVSYKDALAANEKLKALANGDVAVRRRANYRATAADLPVLKNDGSESADELVTRGNTLINSHQYDDAIAVFNKALELDRKNTTALADRAIAYAWTRKFDLARKDIDVALTIDPANAVAFRARALMAEMSSDCAAAIDAYTTSLRTEPQNGFAIGHRAMCEAELRRDADALQDADEAIKVDPTWKELRLVRPFVLAREGKKADAIRETESYLHDNGESSSTLIHLSQLFDHAGARDLAIKFVSRAIAIKPDTNLFIARAKMRDSSDFENQLADIDAALKIAPKDPTILAAKGDLLVDRGDFRAALNFYDGAVQLVPGQSLLTLGRAFLLYRMGRKPEAERSIAAWRREAFTATELNELCWRKATAGVLLESAAGDCNSALKINPDYARAFDSLAFVDLRLGKFEEAISLYTKAIAKAGLPASYMGRAIAFARKGDKPHSDSDRTEALRRDPDVEARFARLGVKL